MNNAAGERSEPAAPDRGAVSSPCSLAGAITKARADSCQEGCREGVAREGLPCGIADRGDIGAPSGIWRADIQAPGRSLSTGELLPRFKAMKRVLEPRSGLSVEFNNGEPSIDADGTAKGGRGVNEPKQRV